MKIRVLLIAGLISGSFVSSPLLAAEEAAAEQEMDMVIKDTGGPKPKLKGDGASVIGSGDRDEVIYGEPVDKVWAPGISNWNALDNQRIVLYVSPFRPYLLTLDRPAAGLRFNDRVAIRYDNNHIYARFDRVFVDGFPYTIKRIEKLDKQVAKMLIRGDKGEDDESDLDDAKELAGDKGGKSDS
ncbi:MAG: DUF6491 family protein [Pseudomonadota bacterium]